MQSHCQCLEVWKCIRAALAVLFSRPHLMAQLVRPVEASMEVLRDVHTKEYLDQLHGSSRKACET